MTYIIHLSNIREWVSMKSPLYHLAIISSIESIAWVTGLINYIDVTYDEYSAGKFGTAKAWHVITKLTRALVAEVGKPHKGAQQSFEAGDGIYIIKVVFYRSLSV